MGGGGGLGEFLEIGLVVDVQALGLEIAVEDFDEGYTDLAIFCEEFGD